MVVCYSGTIYRWVRCPPPRPIYRWVRSPPPRPTAVSAATEAGAAEGGAASSRWVARRRPVSPALRRPNLPYHAYLRRGTRSRNCMHIRYLHDWISMQSPAWCVPRSTSPLPPLQLCHVVSFTFSARRRPRRERKRKRKQRRKRRITSARVGAAVAVAAQTILRSRGERE